MIAIKKYLFLSFVCLVTIVRAQTSVTVNGARLSKSDLEKVSDRYNINIKNGTYWYDDRSGAWGFQNGPTQGFIPAGLQVGSSLKSNASNGNTGVFVNGRQLHYQDVRNLQQIIKVVPGRFWLDNFGNGGKEGKAASFNLIYLAKRQGNNSFYRNNYTGIGAGSSGGTSYVMGKDWSVIID
ncbi:Extra-large guanine nucleotide-binding protein [Flagellimonas maritima]|uniref:Extra-large guanine nucleotide-binding protein n=1 Tax=Flagellimonas maritima TaxID=1383885 RepID=A0A2Z4LTS4_9FLAO|nr:hypothetical protein [Allomuricauda aurantiaca]AWX44944.1 Extra-large guanine nucleotide-binding protein [Allomuricauda aurantiaca]